MRSRSDITSCDPIWQIARSPVPVDVHLRERGACSGSVCLDHWPGRIQVRDQVDLPCLPCGWSPDQTRLSIQGRTVSRLPYATDSVAETPLPVSNRRRPRTQRGFIVRGHNSNLRRGWSHGCERRGGWRGDDDGPNRSPGQSDPGFLRSGPRACFPVL